MMTRKPIISALVSLHADRRGMRLLAVLSGFVVLALLAQLALPLSWTPVPVTGQTFGVAMIAMLWGARLGGVAVLLYVSAGFLGLPIFAGGAAGALGPTTGYLVGMIAASFVMGMLADRGFAGTLLGSYLVCVAGSAITFACGLVVLSFFIPGEGLLASGFFPFLAGDFVKSVTAAVLASRLNGRVFIR